MVESVPTVAKTQLDTESLYVAAELISYIVLIKM